jgi:tripartite ATP-independent transporter DctP family solute receptor
MKKIKVIRLMGLTLSLALCLGLLAGCNHSSTKKTASGTETMTFRLSDSQPVGYVTIDMDNMFAQEVSTKTNGRIHIITYPTGQLGDEKSTLEQMQYGAIDACRIGVGPLADFNKMVGVTNLPYIFSSDSQMFNALDGPVGDTLFKSLQTDSKFVGLVWVDAGARSFYTTKKQIKTPADLKGLKIRVQQSQPAMDLMACFGASATPLGQNDVYSALQSGVVDGAENNWSTYIALNHYEAAKYFIEDEHLRLPEMLVFSQMSWNKMTSSDQQIVRAAAKDAGLWERKQWLVNEAAAEKKALASGVILTKVTDKTPWVNVVKSMYDKHPEWADLIKQIQATK